MDDHHDRSLHGHDKQLEKLIPILPDDNIAENAAEIFSLLSDGTRLKILWLLCHCEECVCDIAEAVGMSAPAVSHHLRLLRQSGLISWRREGKEVLYTLSESSKADFVHQTIDGLLAAKCPFESL